MTYRVKVPGSFRNDLAFVDIETRKVPTGGFVMKNGEPLRNRWQAFLVGIARDGEIVIVDDEPETRLLSHTAQQLDGHRTIAYSATREFDEMILKGRFTNARRAHEPVAFYPALPDAENLEWRNLRPSAAECRYGHTVERWGDLPSREVPKAWTDGREKAVLVHLLRDVAELIYLAGDPSPLARSWCYGVVRHYEFGANLLARADWLGLSPRTAATP